MPRPKTEPPAPPNPGMNDEALKKWGEQYNKWKDENSHLPNLQPLETILQAIQGQRQHMNQTQAGQTQGTKDFLKTVNTEFYYVVEHDKKIEVYTDDLTYIQQLKQQYYVREKDGKLTKVVGDDKYATRHNKPVGALRGSSKISPPEPPKAALKKPEKKSVKNNK